MSAGWYLMHRGWMQSADFRPEPFTEPQAFLWSIEQAAFEAHGQWFNGSLYQVERGEFVTSLHAMMTAFRWSEKRVRGFTQRMVKAGKWAKRGAHQGAKAPTVLIVCNYALFQTPARRQGEATGEAEGERGAKQGRSEGEEQKEGINNSNELERSEGASRQLAPSLPYDDALAAWSQIAAVKGWSPVHPTLPLSDKRRRGLGSILKTHGLEGWIATLQRAADSEMLGGPDPPGWFNLDFVCDPNKFPKVKDGNYDRSFSSRGSEQSPWLAARENMLSSNRVSGSA